MLSRLVVVGSMAVAAGASDPQAVKQNERENAGFVPEDKKTTSKIATKTAKAAVLEALSPAGSAKPQAFGNRKSMAYADPDEGVGTVVREEKTLPPVGVNVVSHAEAGLGKLAAIFAAFKADMAKMQKELAKLQRNDAFLNLETNKATEVSKTVKRTSADAGGGDMPYKARQIGYKSTNQVAQEALKRAQAKQADS